MSKLLMVLSLFLTSCASTIQTASITEAYKTYADEDYVETLELINLAENAKETSEDMKAELAYLKAQSYEKLGELGRAKTLLEYLRDQHATSQYGYLAREKLEAGLE